MDDNSEFLRRRVTELRLQKKVSELQMSHDLGKSDGYIHQITSGRIKPSMDNFLRYASISQSHQRSFGTEKICIHIRSASW